MTWPELRVLWEARDNRYAFWKRMLPRESIEAARIYRLHEADMIRDEAERREAFVVLSMWMPT